jgi:type VI secretion system secreted protein VgrG
MNAYSQDNRPLSISTPLGKDALLLARLVGREEISSLFRFEATLLAPGGTPLDFARLLGQGVTVRLESVGWPTRWINGIVNRLVQGRQILGEGGEVRFLHYQAEIVPTFWLWTKRVQCRIFQYQTVPQILETVLQGLSTTFRLTGEYAPRDFCVQYNESDYAFASRLMEEEGIFYFFQHAEDSHQLVVTDDVACLTEVASPQTLDFDVVEGGNRPGPRIRVWEKSQEITAHQISLDDYCFEMPEKSLAVRAQVSGAPVQVGGVAHRLDVVRGQWDLTKYEYPGAFAQRYDGIAPGGGQQPAVLTQVFSDGQRTARLRLEEETARALEVRGEGDCWHFQPGYRFSLARHFDGNGKYTLIAVEHEASLEEAYLGGSGMSFRYCCRFRGLPAEVPYRPERKTPRPRLVGSQTATVVGLADEPIFTDPYARVKVKFRWDASGTTGAQSSCWIRVAQAWAGRNYGSLYIPRAGQEVLVDFLEGDPDNPIIVGVVYNAGQMPPFMLPGQRNCSGVKTQTVNGQPSNFHGLAFDDTPNAEQIHLHSEKYLTQSCEEAMYLNVAQQHHVNVGGLHSRQVGGLPDTRFAMTAPAGQGSGSGGGAPPAPPVPLSTQWNAGVIGGVASALDLVVGWNGTYTAGLQTSFTIGQANISTFNPLQVGKWFNYSFPFKSFPQGIFQSLSAANMLVGVGANATLTYGSEIDIHRGGAIKREVKPSAADTALGTAYIAAMTANMLAPWLSSLVKESATAWSIAVGPSAALLALQASWMQYNIGCTEVEGKATASHAVHSLTSTATESNNLPLSTIGGRLLDITNEIQPDSDGLKLESADEFRGIVAPFVGVFSKAGQPGDAIVLNAVGDSTKNIPGSIALDASDQTFLHGGPQASLILQTVAPTGSAILQTGAGGSVQVRVGVQDPAAQSISLDSHGVTISSTTAIVLKVGATELKLDASGISLTCNSSRLDVQSQRIEINSLTVQSNADTKWNIKSAALNVAN